MAVLEDQLGPRLADEFKGDAEHMGSLGEWVWEQGIERGLEQGMEQGLEQGLERGGQQAVVASIRSMAKNLSLSAEQAMDVLEIPENRRHVYCSLLAADACAATVE